jgi:YrbI family 3-deoxy-D-manno-octulosonate 8-phosphate phosphatase
MLFDNINYLLRERGAPPLSEEGFFGLKPGQVYELVSQLGVPFEILNTVNLQERDNFLKDRKIELIVLDVDGVFTDGGMFYSSAGEELKKFNVKDGMAITRAIAKGHNFGIISAASRAEVVQQRAKILGIQNVYVGKDPKIEVLESWLYKMGIGFENVAYIGDDINDVPLLKQVGLSAAPSDGALQARNAAAVVLSQKGGQGCIREFIENYICSID